MPERGRLPGRVSPNRGRKGIISVGDTEVAQLAGRTDALDALDALLPRRVGPIEGRGREH